MAQPLIIQQLAGNGELKWNDLSSAFVQATSYTIEWVPRLGGTQTVWTPLVTIPATNRSYTQDVPMVYRLRADFQGHFPKLKLAVFSDTHYFAPSLLVHDGLAFQSYLAADRKMLAQSQAILDVETGSPVTFPSPYRLLSLETNGDFALTSPAYNLPLANAQFLAPAIGEALVSHYQGDEGTRPISPQTQGIIAYLIGQGDPMSVMMANVLTAQISRWVSRRTGPAVWRPGPPGPTVEAGRPPPRPIPQGVSPVLVAPGGGGVRG